MNTRVAVAVHILTLLEWHAGEPVPSEEIARSVGTHPTRVRRLLSTLARAGLTSSVQGAQGGAYLARPGNQITLRDVFDAMSDGQGLIPLGPAPRAAHPVGRAIHRALGPRLHAAERALHEVLAGMTIADVDDEVRRHPRRRPRDGAGSDGS